MNNNLTPPIADDEIDLKDLLKRVVKILERGTIVIILSVMLGGILGLGYFFYSGTTYTSSMVLSSDILVLGNIEALFAPFGTLISEGDSIAIGKRLQMDPGDATKIKALELEGIFDEENSGYCKITVTVTDNSILPQLQKGLIAYLENNEYVERRVSIREKKYNALIEKINSDIQGIDSLKNKVEKGNIISPAEVGSNVLMMEPANLYRLSLEMTEKKQEYMGQLILNDSIELFSGFTPVNEPSNPSWIVCLVVGLGGGLIIGFAILFFMEMDRYVRS